VLLDCDGIMADFVGACVRELASVGVHVRAEDVDRYDMMSAWKLTHGARETLLAAWNRPGFCSSLAPYPGAREGVDALREIAEVYVVTTPMWSSLTWMRERTDWLESRMGIPKQRVVHTEAKHVIDGDLLVDDNDRNLCAWSEEALRRYRATYQGILWSRPWNDHARWDLRASCWDDVMAVLR